MAASNCSGAVVAHIADLGASIDSRTRNGVTPLEMALQSDRFDAADALMERGARLSATAAKRVLLFPRQDSRRTDYAKRATKVEDDANK
jgi:ankyrin repeat protein